MLYGGPLPRTQVLHVDYASHKLYTVQQELHVYWLSLTRSQGLYM